jgi:hypothetical protein
VPTRPSLPYFLGICLEGLRKSTKNLSHDSRSPAIGLNPGPPEHEAGMLIIKPGRSLRKVKKFLEGKEKNYLHVIIITVGLST